MATQIEIISIIIITIIGGVTSAVLAWANSGDPFDARKFIALVIRAAIGAASTALTFQNITDITPFIYLMAFLAGAGVDAVGQGLQTAVGTTRTQAVLKKLQLSS